MAERERVILHSDLNNFYASVECLIQPGLRDKYVAVCGKEEDRHGIVLAKNQAAKMLGIRTGDTVWQAKKKCPELVVVQPHFDLYQHYSQLAREIYMDFTDQIEPFGMDECWLDVTGSVHLMGSGAEIAEQIRKRMEEELGLTVSVGVSFNKVFAKLGSDLKKPNAVTVITKANFKKMLWDLSASELLGVGRSTGKTLEKYGIHTIGQLANANPELLKQWLGVNGARLHRWANGLDTSPVQTVDYQREVKSVGRGITCVEDLDCEDDVWKVILAMAQKVAVELRSIGLHAGGIGLEVKNNQLVRMSMQSRFDVPVQTAGALAERAMEMFKAQYDWKYPVRALAVRAIYLTEAQYSQLTITDGKHPIARRAIEGVMDELKAKYGREVTTFGTLMCENKMPDKGMHEIVLPGLIKD
ncbi:MAG: DNA polymerase IV [Clostridia bacterium]|nr:DNA polymerase IV [Clostridia bacterium]